jgi:SecD/SecF fusion protein
MQISPGIMFFIELLWLGLFGWYFATDYGTRKRVLAFVLVFVAVALSFVMIYPPEKKIQLGLDIKGGTSFLIKLQSTAEKEVTPALLDQAVEVIRKRVDYFGASEPIISPVGKDRILVQIPGLDTEKIQEARQQLSRVALRS